MFQLQTCSNLLSNDNENWLYMILSFAGVEIDQANWDSSKVREKLSRDIEAHVDSVRTTKLSELTSTYEVGDIVLLDYFLETHYVLQY